MRTSPYPNAAGIYCIRNTVNAKCYIGSAANLRDRWNKHRSLLRSQTSHSNHLQAAWNKYGEAAFVFEILEIVDNRRRLTICEQRWITQLKPAYNKRQLADRNDYVNRGRKPSAETIAKRTATRAARMANDPNYGRGSIEAMAAARRGTKHRTESIALMREAKMGNHFRANSVRPAA